MRGRFPHGRGGKGGPVEQAGTCPLRFYAGCLFGGPFPKSGLLSRDPGRSDAGQSAS